MSEPFYRESRLYTRVNNDIPVVIYYNGQLICKRLSKNISVGGILIKTEDLGLPAYALVDVELKVPGESTPSVIRIPGVVNRVNHEELAITFEALDKGAELVIKKYVMLQVTPD